MDSQWQPYADMAGRQARYSSISNPQQQQQQQQQRDLNDGSTQSHQPSSAFGYEAYQTPSVPSHPQSMATSPIGTPRIRGYAGDGDVAMEDADPYNRMKYPSRPSHSHRSSAQYISQEDSSAARRYSPMKAVTPSSHYAASPQQSSQSSYGPYMSQSASARQSPTRSQPYSTPSQSYYSTPSMPLWFKAQPYYIANSHIAASSRQQPLQLPPIQAGDASNDQYFPQSATAQLNAVFGRETKSPRHLRMPQRQSLDMPRGPVPKMRKVETVQDLEPRINPQPAFRRANPEGGFISVS